jgi:hypothetical protein
VIKKKGGDIMPGFDGTGPQGFGAMTGRVRGDCNSDRNSAVNFGHGPGGGRKGRLARGRCFRRYFPFQDQVGAGEPVNEVERLKAEAGRLKDSLDQVWKRIEALEQDSKA